MPVYGYLNDSCIVLVVFLRAGIILYEKYDREVREMKEVWDQGLKRRDTYLPMPDDTNWKYHENDTEGVAG